MSAQGKSRWAIGVGIPTLVTIIVAVLLTTFSVLTLVTARADLRLSEKAIESTQNYYSADGQAEHWLAELDGFVAKGHEDMAADLAAAGYRVVGITGDGRLLVRQTFSLDAGRELAVDISIKTDGRLDVLAGQTVSKR